jgi:hypothetical protein
MGVPTSEVGYTSATTGRGDHEVNKGHVGALAQNIRLVCSRTQLTSKAVQHINTRHEPLGGTTIHHKVSTHTEQQRNTENADTHPSSKLDPKPMFEWSNKALSGSELHVRPSTCYQMPAICLTVNL